MTTPNRPPTSRRSFLARTASGGAALAFLENLAGAQAAFRTDLTGIDVDFDRLGAQYSLAPGVTYLNHASIGTIPVPVQKALQRYLTLCETNPWLHMWGPAWQAPLAAVRENAARFLGCDAAEVAINHNTTEGFNMLASGLELASGDEVVFSTLNHAGASQCWFHHAQQRGYKARRFEFPLEEVADMDDARIVELHARQISDATRVLVLPHLDNTVGLRHPVRKIAEMARARGVRYVAVDGAQAIGMLPVDVHSLGVDFYCTSPHKWLQAPKGLGLMFLAKNVQKAVRAAWVTWGQQRFRGSVRVFEDYGTRDMPQVLALGDAIDFQRKLGAKRKAERLEKLWKHLYGRCRELEEKRRIKWHSPRTFARGGSLCLVEVVGQDANTVFDRMFEKHGFVFRPFRGKTGKHTLNALRISPNVYTTIADIDRFFGALLG